MAESNSNQISKKIILMGLDNGGKTSILLSLQRDVNLLSYLSLNPTQGLQITNFIDRGVQFNIWDFGGQKHYRDDYFQHLDEYIVEVDKIFYVIDIQDIERYDLALEYLKKIIDYLKNNQIKTEFTIFLHKFDPNLENDPKFSEAVLSVNLFTKIKEIIPSEIPYDVFKTTIYTVFQKRPTTI